ncbi:MAG: hypothetical protein AAGU06_03695 [Candidatus Shapirobacteria bacterium]
MIKKIKYLFGILVLLSVFGFLYFSKRTSTIFGDIKYPAARGPYQIICAINSVNKKETCMSDDNFIKNGLKVKQGTYYVYSKIDETRNDSRWDDIKGYKAFYTEYSKAEKQNKTEEELLKVKENNKPILIGLHSGEVIRNINFDWENGNFYDSIVSK